jgi:DNA polymerase I-like protein with 3'-5' exonuclease and polymerase domains
VRKPWPGQALAYVDFAQQEFGIAAALSGDEAMRAAYESGDPYLAFAEQAGAVPSGATRKTHRQVRDRFKKCTLGIQYGMMANTLASELGETKACAREMIDQHKRIYHRYWEWSRATGREGRRSGFLETVYGWRLHVDRHTKPGTICNFPLQANGAEILRLACCRLIERGVRICAPIHDAVLIEAPIDEIDGAVLTCMDTLAEASGSILGGFRLRTDCKTVLYPDRFMDERDSEFWDEVCDMMGTDGARRHR